MSAKAPQHGLTLTVFPLLAIFRLRRRRSTRSIIYLTVSNEMAVSTSESCRSAVVYNSSAQSTAVHLQGCSLYCFQQAAQGKVLTALQPRVAECCSKFCAPKPACLFYPLCKTLCRETVCSSHLDNTCCGSRSCHLRKCCTTSWTCSHQQWIISQD